MIGGWCSWGRKTTDSVGIRGAQSENEGLGTLKGHAGELNKQQVDVVSNLLWRELHQILTATVAAERSSLAGDWRRKKRRSLWFVSVMHVAASREEGRQGGGVTEDGLVEK